MSNYDELLRVVTAIENTLRSEGVLVAEASSGVVRALISQAIRESEEARRKELYVWNPNQKH